DKTTTPQRLSDRMVGPRAPYFPGALRYHPDRVADNVEPGQTGPAAGFVVIPRADWYLTPTAAPPVAPPRFPPPPPLPLLPPRRRVPCRPPRRTRPPVLLGPRPAAGWGRRGAPGLAGGRKGARAGDLFRPPPPVTDRRDRLWVVDFTPRIQAFDLDGHYLGV